MADSLKALREAYEANKAHNKKKPVKKASAKPAPPPPREPVSRAPTRKAATETPAKSTSSKAFSLFKKSKKTEKSKEKAKKAKKAKKAPKPEQKKTGTDGDNFFKNFVQHVGHEFKEALEKIKPKALLNTAAESIQSLKSIAKSDERSPFGEPDGSDAAEDNLPEADRSFVSQADAAGERSATLEPPAMGGENASPAQAPDQEEDPPTDFSPAKAQRHIPKKQKTESLGDEDFPEPEDELSDTDAAAEEDRDQPDSETQEVDDDRVKTKDEEDAGPDLDLEDESPAEEEQAELEEDFSTAKVQRHTPKKQKTESLDDEDFPEPEGELSDTDAAAEEDTDQPDSEAQGVDDDRVETKDEEDDRAETKDEEDAGPDLDLEDESPAEEEQAELKEEKSGKDEKEKSKKKQAPPPPAKLSKAEQALRSFHALQVILNNTTWSSIVLDTDSKPSTLYSPRERFDSQFSDTVFREGVRAASRLATSYAFQPEKILFNEKVIETVRKFPLDPEGRIKKDDDLLSEVLDEETAKAALNLYKKPPVRYLLFSVATRVGTFVPTIEILARIYLGLRKKTDISSGQRLMIQDEVLLRYKKSVYTDTKATQARNLALNYFMDYLWEYGMKIYKDRFASGPEGQDNIETHYRRHEIIKKHCFHTFDEWGTRVGLSSQGLINLKARFSETADLSIKEKVGEIPNPS